MPILLEAPRSPCDPHGTSTLKASERIRPTLTGYDYAAQDPINEYDLDGTFSCAGACVPGPTILADPLSSSGPTLLITSIGPRGPTIIADPIPTRGPTILITTIGPRGPTILPDPIAERRPTILNDKHIDIPVGNWNVRIGIHGPHHEFPVIGKAPHIQVNVWKPAFQEAGENQSGFQFLGRSDER